MVITAWMNGRRCLPRLIVVNSVSTVEGAGSGTNFLTGVSVTVNDGGLTYLDLIVKQLGRIDLARQQQISGGIVGVTVSETVDCGGGGTITASGDLADPNALTPGDTITGVFTNCREVDFLISGRMDMTINSISSGFTGFPPFDIDVSTTLTNLSASDSLNSFTADGDMRVAVSADTVGNVSATYTGNSLTVTDGGDTQTLTSYNYVLTGNDATGDYSIEASGTINSTILDGSVTFLTVTPFTGNDFVGTGDPTQGQLLMTSNFDDSQARLTAQPDGVNIMIEIDSDGDGIFEETVMSTWTTLDSL